MLRYKKTGVRGYQSIKIKTLNGSFDFKVRKYVLDGVSTNWLRLNDPDLALHYESQLLRDFSVKYASLLSYEQAESLVATRMGNDKLSDQRIFHIVSEYAEAVKLAQESQIKACESIAYTCEAKSVDIYDPQSAEVIFLCDGVCVSEQKPLRDGLKKVGKERTTTEVMMLQTSLSDTKAYKTIVAAKDIDTVKLVQSELLLAYGAEVRSLPIVAISDGARSIKSQNREIFGKNIMHILDWYHLQSKVHQLMSQIAPSKALKEECSNLIIHYLWYGKVMQAVLVLKFMLVKNEVKRAELVGYLEKNETHIIDYEKRKTAGKIIGSGRTEKQNDVLVSKRQKRKAMAWSPKGSQNLAIVTAYHRNDT
jgi:hypothetical protein